MILCGYVILGEEFATSHVEDAADIPGLHEEPHRERQNPSVGLRNSAKVPGSSAAPRFCDRYSRGDANATPRQPSGGVIRGDPVPMPQTHRPVRDVGHRSN